MRKINLLALLIFYFGLFETSMGQVDRFAVKGQLKNGSNGEPVGFASITLKETAFSATSSESGQFLIPNVFEGKFVLNIIVPGFQSLQMPITVKGETNLGTLNLLPYGYEEKSGEALQKTIRATNVAELFVNRPNFIGGHSVYGIPSEPKKLVGNYYLDPKWNKASILLYKNSEVMEGFYVRYNINSNNFEIRREDVEEISIIPGLRIQNIVWYDVESQSPRFFVNGMDFKDEGAPISGFFEVLVDGKIPLVRRTIATIKASNYNQALMVGEKDDYIIKRNHYYYVVNGDVFPIPKNRKNIYHIFGEKAVEMEAFVKVNKLNLKENSSLFSIFTHYNSLFNGFQPVRKNFDER